MIKYPEKPWVDKQTFTHTTQAGDEIAGIYDAPTNTWSFYKGNSDLVFTNTVYTVDVKPADASIARAGQLFNDALPLPGVDNLVTQQDVNWYLYDLINSIDGGSQIWVGLDEPPGTDNDNPITKFWWNPNTEELYVWSEKEGEWKLTGLMEFDRPPIVSISPPTSHPKFPGKPLEEGDFWIDANHIMHYWTGSEWQEVVDSELYAGKYLPLTGGTMTGNVKFDATPYNGLTIYGMPGKDYNNGTKIVFRAENGSSVSDPQVLIGVEPTEDNHAVTKKYVDDIAVELEEEIDAIAPSVERGVWAFNLGGLASSRGQLSMYDNDYSNVGNPIGIFKQAKSIWLNEEDNAGTPHGFDNVEAGNLLELFVEGEADYGLFEVVDVHDETNGAAQWWVIEVNFVRALSDTSLASNGDNIRLKIFSAPSGGTADGFVLKTGDTMEGPGPLTIKTKKTSDDFNSPGSNTAYIKFENDNNGSINSLSLYRGGPDKTLIADGGFTARGHIWSSGHYYAYNGSSTRFPSLRLEENEGKLAWGSSTGYAKLKWNNRGISEITFNNSIGETGQVPTKTDTGIEWVTPGQALTNWDLINANNKNWGNEFYHNALITGFGGYKSNGDEYNGQSNYGIFISDSMLEKLLKEDYPDKEIDIDKWVKYWTGEGTIELNTGNSGANGTSQTRTLTEVKRVNYNNDGRYPGVKLMWADQASLSFYSLFIKFVKTAGAFEAGEVNTIQVPASNILYYTGSYTPSREEDVNDSTVYWLDRNGNISNSTPSNGAFFPWAWVKENYPWMTGLNIMDGLGVSGIYDAFGNAKSLLDPTKTFNSFPAYVNAREFNGVRGIGVWSDNQMASNDRIQLWGLQEDFEYYTINS